MTMSIDEAVSKQTHGALSGLMARQTFWVFLAFVVTIVVMTLASDVFATERNLYNVFRNFAFVGIMALGMTAVIITGGIDLSVGSTLVLAAIVTSITMGAGNSIEVGILAGLGAALAVGLVNGILIAYVGMPSFVVTLGMLSVARSLAQVVSNNQIVYQLGPDANAIMALGGGSSFGSLLAPFGATGGIPNPALVLLVLALLAGFAFRWTRWGRYIFAIGGNENAAILTGVPVRAIKLSVYVVSALTAGIAGILEVGWLGSVTVNLGTGMELQVIAASVIGGANLAGGAGTAFGAVVGSALIEVIRNSLILLGIPTFWQGTFVGCFIVIAVLVDRIRAMRQST